MSRPPVRDSEMLLRAYERRITLLERRLTKAGAGGGGGGGGGGTYVPPPALPAPVVVDATANMTLTGAAGAWGNVTAIAPITLTPERDLWVEVHVTAMCSSTTGYISIGAEASGGVTVPPSTDQQAGGGAWGSSPYGTASNFQAITGTKIVLIPGGVATTFTMQAMRQTASGTQTANYSMMRVIPLRWDDTPIPVASTRGALTRRTASGGQAITTSFVVDWATAVADSGHFTFDAATDEFTCKIAGTYQITAQVGTSTVATDNSWRIQIQVNGTTLAEPAMRRTTTQGYTLSATTTAALALGDKVRIMALGGNASGTIDAFPRTYVDLVPVVVNTAPASELPLTSLLLAPLFAAGTPAETPEVLVQGGWAQWQGAFQMAAGTAPVTPAIAYQTGTVLLTLPVGYRPNRQLVFPSGPYGASAMIVANVRVEVNGNVLVYANNGGTGSTTGHFSLGAVRYRVA